jgi:hypothetical protein
LWEEIRVAATKFGSVNAWPEALVPTILSVRSKIPFYKGVIRLKYEFFDCALSLTVSVPASPQAKICLLRMNLCQIHWLSILRAAYLRRFRPFALVAVFHPEIPSLARITDETARTRACVRQGIGRERISALFKLNGLHLNVMLVTEGA